MLGTITTRRLFILAIAALLLGIAIGVIWARAASAAPCDPAYTAQCCACEPSGAAEPAPLPHLSDADDQRQGAVSIRIAASLRTRRMRERDLPARRLSLSDTASLYWTPAQMVAHHTSNGCALDTGDLLGSGTVSGPTPDALGCLLEITQGGAQPVELPGGESRHFLADGDELVLSGWCERPGHARIGFGECRAVVLPAAGLGADGEAA